MSPLMFFYMALIAYLLSPGVLVTLPPGGGKTAVAVTHAVALSLVWALTHKMVWGFAR
jgi:hypothetical protein